jgi:predicted esterase
MLKQMTWEITDGDIKVTREALVYIPFTASGLLPIMFAFHGHAGTAADFAKKQFEILWPHAIVVYPQGLLTKSGMDTTGRNTGWQHSPGEVNSHTGMTDQDVKFFDAMLSTLITEHKGNSAFVLPHGWSNGGEFIYNVLWKMRPNLAAICCASSTLGTTVGKKPLPVMHVAGKNDHLVAYSSQLKTEQMILILNQCDPLGSVWCPPVDNGTTETTKYHSDCKCNLIFLDYDGDHSYPPSVPAFIVKFFRRVVWLNTNII